MSESTPICRCRVLYLGSSVPQQTKDGLQGIQEPLQELYPDQGATGAKGIDSWLSVWSNGILLENVDENHKKITRFFPIESLHYCAAVRYVLVPEKNTLHSPNPRFLPLDSPFARTPNPTHPPLFAAILRRTTGIKVLECHAFICKREVAANALVRCCFHAYADSSYAKQVDTAGSIYGTLASERLTSKEKIDEWKMSRSQSGSTMTLNTITNNNQKDDISIYNGDENHKVWAGSQDNLDGIYDVYSTSTISRPTRPRQISQPVAVPPPPVKDKKKKTKQKSLSGSREDLYHPMMNGKASSLAGSVVKTRQIQPQMNVAPPQPIYIMTPHPGTLPNPKFFKHHGNTYSHRPRSKVLIPARPVPPPLVPVAPVIIPTTMQKNKKKHKHVEEPIYMPSNRALSPVASYQPVNFPHEAYLMQHYATMESQGKQRSKNKEKNSDKAKLNKKLGQSMNGLDDPNVMNDESPFNTGIYKKKGHLNERAFSYSIRQEHRSRSYGSLANLKFASPIPNGHDVEDREDMKKEREIMQMVQDLDLSGDELERSEVPRGMYDTRAGPPGPVIVTAPQINGRGHRR
ncbi:uncharacterized protein LOC130891295 [Diorhabda carinulata]|uniref:uncharacterized protein LOC130891295 n=1 Tax=Diorhabda carinulata TaxID=1163345 RepID=UPI0025A2193C|nr:uncharacterized protein LOC130891295 [Diorhabda carinulata]XP_057651921.1 uncharacterized protein LOC130891295 [Diorhabda carinulata]